MELEDLVVELLLSKGILGLNFLFPSCSCTEDIDEPLKTLVGMY